MSCIMQNNIGTIFRITIKDCETDDIVNVSGCDTKEIIFTKPTGTKVTKTAAYYTDGSDGIIQYATVAGDLDEVGVWQMQAHVVIGAGSDWYTEIDTFRVNKNL